MQKKETKRNNIIYEGNPYIKMIEQKLNDELNNYCVECGNENPEYISINNGVFICVECVQNHLRFPKNISKIIKNNKNSLTLNEIQCLLCGGNKALLDFINNEFPKLSEFPPNILYRTQAMVYYRQNLQYLINGGVPPIKPSIKYAYSIYNFINNTNQNTNNIINTQKDIYNYNDDRGFLNNIENNSKFYNSGYNF
jgi:ADP-ribosylation factor GTPase-activating protein 1